MWRSALDPHQLWRNERYGRDDDFSSWSKSAGTPDQELENQIPGICNTEHFWLWSKSTGLSELTAMLYSFIDREYMKPPGAAPSTASRTLTFTSTSSGPPLSVSEEERIAAIDAEQLRKKQEKGKASERRQQSLKFKGRDPEAVLSKYLASPQE